MMFSGKLLAIVGAVLAVTVNGSPVEVGKRELQAVRPFCIPLDVAEESKQWRFFLHSVNPASSSVTATGTRETALVFPSTPTAKMFPTAGMIGSVLSALIHPSITVGSSSTLTFRSPQRDRPPDTSVYDFVS
jgi:hypothetical protein